MADLTPVTTWTADDARHLARRAGFGLSPEEGAALAQQAPGAAVDAWVDGTAADFTAFDAALAHADPVDEPQRGSSPNVVAAIPGPHPYLVEGAEAWRNDLTRAQASLAFRMQYGPYPMQERLVLFWHNLFATGWHKVDSTALMLQQMGTLRALGLARFDDLHVAVSKDPAMEIWLDSVLNRADGTNVPNENYARESMELYSLGADNGYNQQDITQLARALSGWSFTVLAADAVPDPTSPPNMVTARGTFRVYDGSAVSGEYLWNNVGAATLPTALPRRHGTGPVTFLGQAFADIGVAATGMAKGEDVLRSIIQSRGPQAAQFLARRLVLHFVTGSAAQGDIDQVAALIQSAGFDLRAVVKALLKSAWFFDPVNRFALAEGPVSWTVRAARALGFDLASADSATAAQNLFPAWAMVTPTFDFAGMRLLDPSGPNGWHEDVAWLNSNTIRYRAKLASALALGETFSQGGGPRALVPSDASRWFPSAPAAPQDVLDRVVALLQPAPIPAAVQQDWLSRLWPAGSTFTWDTTGQNKARELAFLVLCSPAGQLY
ncbi:MAG TPA: DUF1800 family protein [Anaeromyxobacteraceae bacterium]|nr:DUF1800 family protein [Anaeromyxobacteraceae bacterium]